MHARIHPSIHPTYRQTDRHTHNYNYIYIYNYNYIYIYTHTYNTYFNICAYDSCMSTHIDLHGGLWGPCRFRPAISDRSDHTSGMGNGKAPTATTMASGATGKKVGVSSWCGKKKLPILNPAWNMSSNSTRFNKIQKDLKAPCSTIFHMVGQDVRPTAIHSHPSPIVTKSWGAGGEKGWPMPQTSSEGRPFETFQRLNHAHTV